MTRLLEVPEYFACLIAVLGGAKEETNGRIAAVLAQWPYKKDSLEVLEGL